MAQNEMRAMRGMPQGVQVSEGLGRIRWARQAEPHVNLGPEACGREYGQGLHTVRCESERFVEGERGRIPFSHFKLDGADVSALVAELEGSLK